MVHPRSLGGPIWVVSLWIKNLFPRPVTGPSRRHMTLGGCRQTGTSEFKSLIIAFSQVFRAIPTDPKLHQVKLILFSPPSKAINPKSDTRSLPPFTHETNVQKEKEPSVDKDRLMLAILTSSVYRFIMSLLSTPLPLAVAGRSTFG